MNINIMFAEGQKNENGYTCCGMCREKLGFWDICEVYFCKRCKEENECYGKYLSYENCRKFGSSKFYDFMREL